MSLSSIVYNTQFRARQRVISAKHRLLRKRAPQIDPQTFSPNRVLFVLSGLIGDSVMSTPAIIEARRIWPNARISIVGQKHNAELLSACSYFDDFYIIGADPMSIRKSHEIREFRNWLGLSQFDAAVILLGDQFAHLLAKAGIPVRVGVRESLMTGCLTHTYSIGSPRTWGSEERLNALRCLGYDIGPTRPMLCVETASADRARQKLKLAGLTPDNPYAAIHPFGSTRRQWWDIRKTADLAGRLRDEMGLQTVLIGGHETRSTARLIPKGLVVDLTGKLRIPEMVAVFNDAKVAISTDSGPFHIAGALGKDVIGLFRARRPEHAKAYENTEIVFGENNKCQMLCQWDSCRAQRCLQMESIDVESIVRTVTGRQV